MRVLVIGDPYMPASVFTAALAERAVSAEVTALQIGRTDAEPPRTDSERRLREYAGDPAEVARSVAGHDVLVVHGAPVSDEALAAPGLQMVCCARGGPVNVDVAAATARGIPVVNTPGKNAEAVAELTVAFALVLMRKVTAATRFLLDGGAFAESVFEGREFFGREATDITLGLVGFGHVGQAVATRAAALGFHVLAFDPVAPSAVPPGVQFVGLDELVRRADILSLHARASAENRRMIDAGLLARMRPNAALINTARETLVDETALLQALRCGHLSGAALDIVEPGPAGARNPLLDEPTVLVTPHVGGATGQTLRRGAAMAADAVVALAAGLPLPHVANGDALRGQTVVP